MSGFGAWLLNLLTGGLPDKIIGAWQAHEARKLAAMNDEQKRAHDAMLQARADALAVRLATAGFWEMRLLTFLIAAPFVWHLWLVGFDTMYPQPWNVEAWPAPFDEWEGAILLSFFGIAGGVSSVRSIASAIATRKRKGSD
jgi:hypothetical protein